MEVFYETYADVTFRFGDGRTIKANSVFLAAKSTAFNQLFKNSPSKRDIDIQDYDFSTFKLFLDCLMEFQECTAIDALLIFPIAWKYEIKRLIKKCVDVLKPVDLDENFCLALNMALVCQCSELIDILLGFLEKRNYFYRLLDEEKYCLLLEPESLKKLMSNVVVDSCILGNVFKWAHNYMKKNQKNFADVKTFFEAHDIAKYVKLYYFESIDSVLKFTYSDFGKSFFTPEQYWAYEVAIGFGKGKSAWFKIKAGEKIVEQLTIKNVALMTNFKTLIRIVRNKIVTYDYFDNENVKVINVDISFDLNDAENKVTRTKWWETPKNIKKQGIYFSPEISRSSTNTICNVNMKVIVTFNFDMRILKSSPKNYTPTETNDEDLYYFKEVDVLYEKL